MDYWSASGDSGRDRRTSFGETRDLEAAEKSPSHNMAHRGTEPTSSGMQQSMKSPGLGCVSGICAKGMKRVHDDSVQRFYEELTKNMRARGNLPSIIKNKTHHIDKTHHSKPGLKLKDKKLHATSPHHITHHPHKSPHHHQATKHIIQPKSPKHQPAAAIGKAPYQAEKDQSGNQSDDSHCSDQSSQSSQRSNMSLFNDALAKKKAGDEKQKSLSQESPNETAMEIETISGRGRSKSATRQQSKVLESLCNSYSEGDDDCCVVEDAEALNDSLVSQSSSLSLGTPTRITNTNNKLKTFAFPLPKKKIQFGIIHKSFQEKLARQHQVALSEPTSEESSPDRRVTSHGFTPDSSSVESSPHTHVGDGRNAWDKVYGSPQNIGGGAQNARDIVYGKFEVVDPTTKGAPASAVNIGGDAQNARDIVYGKFEVVDPTTKGAPASAVKIRSLPDPGEIQIISSPEDGEITAGADPIAELDWFGNPTEAQMINKNIIKIKKRGVSLPSTTAPNQQHNTNQTTAKRASGKFSRWSPSISPGCNITPLTSPTEPPLPSRRSCGEFSLLPPNLQSLCYSSGSSGRSEVQWENSMKKFAKRYSTTVPFIDSHCHIDFLFDRIRFKGHSLKSYMAENADTFLPSFGGCIAVFCNPRTFTPNSGLWLKLLHEDSNVWAAVGCHPKSATDFNERAEEGMKAMLHHPRVKAVGEIGLDFSGTFFQHAERQKQVLEKQCQIAMDAKKPIVIHSRDSEEAILETLTKILPKNYKIHRHCFTGCWAEAEVWMNRFPNSYIGLTPLVTWDKKGRAWGPREVAARIPLSRLLLETDAPYFLPQCINKDDMEHSHPGFAITVAEAVANLQGCSIDTVLEAAFRNTCDMYDINPDEIATAMQQRLEDYKTRSKDLMADNKS